MKVKENRCCDCAGPGYPCRGNACNLRNYTAYYCDSCGKETEKDGLCEDCYIEEILAEVKQSCPETSKEDIQEFDIERMTKKQIIECLINEKNAINL